MSKEIIEKIGYPRRWWDFLIKAAIRGANDLRNSLHISELGFRKVVGYSHADARGYYLYAILDEVQKAGIAMIRWKDFLTYEDEDYNSDEDQLSRIILESIIEEQSLWQRKLSEVLISLVCFETTNENDYYRHFLLLSALDDHLSVVTDLKDFYNCPNKNIEHGITMLKDRIAKIEDKIDLSRCWYLRKKKKLRDRNTLNPGQILNSMRSRMKFALPLCTSAEKLALGLSYGYTYSKPSKDIHFSPSSFKLDINEATAEVNFSRTGLLVLHILLRCQGLLKIIPKGINEQISRVFKENKTPKSLLKWLTDTKIEVGDFVLAYGDLAEILEVKVSPFGYRCYKVRYLSERPIPKIEEDYFPAQYVRLLFRIQDLKNRFQKEMGDYAKSIPEDKIQEFIRKSAIELWEKWGLREHLKKPPEDQNKKIKK
jgi:hypothetical protein